MEQLALAIKTRGGRREGAGRPRSSRHMPHVVREKVRKGTPVLVTLRVAGDLPSLREGPRFAVIARAAELASGETGRIVHYSVQHDHLHLMAEAGGTGALSGLMRRFQIRAALGLNALLGRSGAVFPERYHYQTLATPRQVRNAYAYMFNNRRHHVYEAKGTVLPADYLDPFSTAVLFDGWREEIECAASWADPAMAWPAESWLLRVGWRRHGRIGFDEIPAMGRQKRHV